MSETTWQSNHVVSDNFYQLLFDEEKKAAVQEVVDVVESYKDKVTLRGSYLNQGFRSNTDLRLWMHGKGFEDVQGGLLTI